MTWSGLHCPKAPGQKLLSLWRSVQQVQQDWILTMGTRKVYFLLEVECLTFQAAYQQRDVVHYSLTEILLDDDWKNKTCSVWGYSRTLRHKKVTAAF